MGKWRVLRILSPDDLVMENGAQYAETNVPGFLSVFSTQVPARGRRQFCYLFECRNRLTGCIFGKPTPISLPGSWGPHEMRRPCGPRPNQEQCCDLSVASENSICLQNQQDTIRLCHIVTWMGFRARRSFCGSHQFQN